MKQPTKEEITKKVNDVLNNRLSREDVSEWARKYITNEDDIELVDLNAWHFLVEVSSIDLMIMPNEYLFSVDDLIDVLNKYM